MIVLDIAWVELSMRLDHERWTDTTPRSCLIKFPFEIIFLSCLASMIPAAKISIELAEDISRKMGAAPNGGNRCDAGLWLLEATATKTGQEDLCMWLVIEGVVAIASAAKNWDFSSSSYWNEWIICSAEVGCRAWLASYALAFQKNSSAAAVACRKQLLVRVVDWIWVASCRRNLGFLVVFILPWISCSGTNALPIC